MKNIKKKLTLFFVIAALLLTVTVIPGTTPASANSPFSYAVGETFIVDGVQFKIVNSALRYAVAVNRVSSMDWGKANVYATGFAMSHSYILSSGLPGYSDYNDATFRANVGNLDGTWEWTSTPNTSAGNFWIGTSSGVGYGNASLSGGVRPALFLKSGLYKSSVTNQLYEPLPSTFGDLTIQ